MYRVMTDLDGRFILTYSGPEMAFWFSDFRYDTFGEAVQSPDRDSF